MSGPRVSTKVIRETLERNSGNVKATAAALGLSRNRIYERLTREGIDPAPIRAGAVPPVRVHEAGAELIRRCRRRLAVALDADINDTDLLAQFIDERLEAWVEEKVAAAAERG